MITLAALLLTLPAAPGTDFVVEASPVEWKDLDAGTFDLRQRLPETRRTKSPDLVADMRGLLALRFEIPGDPPLRSFGDLAAAAAKVPSPQRPAWLAGVAKRAPKVFEAHGKRMRELLLDDVLLGEDWDPEDDHRRDGLYFGDSWDLEAEGRKPWNDLRVDPIVHQAATLTWRDLATWKAVENDYRAYPQDVGAAYEEIYPVAGSYRRGVDPAGRAFSSLRVHVRCDLPFPFSGYTCDLRILNRETAAGELVTDIYSPSDDFHWLAGRDVFLPVQTTAGAPVGHVVVRLYGFNLDGVPDGARHHREALRASLGNLRRKVGQQPAGEFVSSEPGALVPEFVVRGRR